MISDPANFNLIKKFLLKRGLSDVSYKEKYFKRRLAVRMRRNNCNTYEEYYDFLCRNKDEISLLKKSLSINVTSFFRDPSTWEEFSKVLLEYINDKLADKSNTTLRIWSSGCAVGAEPYSIAMVILDKLGKYLHQLDVKIYATDFNEELLMVARKGIYEGQILENIPKRYLINYFDPFGTEGFRIKYKVRKMVEFSFLDLTKSDFPFKKMDFIFCRNVIIYFSKELQEKLMKKYYDILVPRGVLVLGRTEILHPNLRSQFRVISLKHRFYKKRTDEERQRLQSILPKRLSVEKKPKSTVSTKKESYKKTLTLDRVRKKSIETVKSTKRSSIYNKPRYTCPVCNKKFYKFVEYRIHERESSCARFAKFVPRLLQKSK